MCKKLNYCQTYIVKFGLAKGLSCVTKLLETKQSRVFSAKTNPVNQHKMQDNLLKNIKRTTKIESFMSSSIQIDLFYPLCYYIFATQINTKVSNLEKA